MLYKKVIHRLGRQIIGLILALWCCQNALAELAFKNPLSDEQTRKVGGITAVAQDRYGFVWIGGEAALGRFDGSHLRIFEHQPGNNLSLNSSYIHKIITDVQGNLWVGTESGLCQYNYTFEHFECDYTWPARPVGGASVRTLAVDYKNGLYVGGRMGLFYLPHGEKVMQRIELPNEKAHDHRSLVVIDLLIDNQGFVWVATTYHGVFRYHPQQGLIDHIVHEPQNPASLVNNMTTSLLIDSKRRLWVGTYGGGLSVFTHQGQHLANFTHAQHQHAGFSSDVIWDLYEDHEQRIWVAFDQGGIARFDEKNYRFIAQRHRMYDNTSIASDQVRVIYEDHAQDLWLGTFDKGISYFNHNKGLISIFKHQPEDENSLSHSAILALRKSQEGKLWIGTEDGLNLFDPATGGAQRFTRENSELPVKAVLSIGEKDKDTLWLGSWSGGLVEFNTQTHKLTPLTGDKKLPGTENSNFIWDILKASDGSYWFATELNGVAHVSADLSEGHNYHANDQDPFSLSHDFVWRIIERRNGNILLGTHGGLDEFIPDGKQFKHWLTGDVAGGAFSKRITALYEATNDDIWVGTQDRGVFCISPDGTIKAHYTKAQGMPALTASAILEDGLNRIWVATINGLVVIDPITQSLSVFSHDNGLAGNNFNRNAFIQGDDGFFYLGGADGLNRFDPERMRPQGSEFPVYVTGLKLQNSLVKPGTGPLMQSTLFAPSLWLDHRDSMLAFDFAALNFKDASTLEFAYKLEGFDNAWRTVGNMRSATYTNLPPGKYHFTVRAKRRGGRWMHSAPIAITVSPAPWLSVWALGGYSLLLVLAGVLMANYVNLRHRSKRFERLSMTDPLTGLRNRLGINLEAKQLLARPDHSHLGLAIVDVDHFKHVNDTYGHDQGDSILKAVSETLEGCVRRSDILGRWGGEEFLLICPEVDETSLKAIGEKIRQSIEALSIDGTTNNLKLTVSVGLTLFGEKDDLDASFKRADEALYRAKDSGRNRVVYLNPSE